MRFSNPDVLRETEGVAEAIWDEIERLTGREVPSPSSGVSPNGLGEKGGHTSEPPSSQR